MPAQEPAGQFAQQLEKTTARAKHDTQPQQNFARVGCVNRIERRFPFFTDLCHEIIAGRCGLVANAFAFIAVNPNARDLHKLDLAEVEETVGGESLRGRTGGAVTLAVSMAMILTQAFDWADGRLHDLMK